MVGISKIHHFLTNLYDVYIVCVFVYTLDKRFFLLFSFTLLFITSRDIVYVYLSVDDDSHLENLYRISIDI